ncbi:hypothetical protein BDW59DRAFT_171355 [Aspergillus cavernicola]|uniref:Zn(2)-C6 fungal-type domain-containing protein n=1 Tax=Aspergillus cavernicola TaxID=176166 RepID=A0ABR4IK98_9EURO
MAEDLEKPRQACDCCRSRKVKCDRGLPCKNCDAGNLRCQYLHSIRRTGPKEGRGRRQSQLRRGLADFGKDQFQTITHDAPFGLSSGSSVSTSDEPSQRHAEHSQPSPTLFHNVDVILQPESDNNTALSLNNAFQDALGYSRQLSLSLLTHVQLFVQFLFPIMPVIDGDELLSDATRLDELSPSRYALIVALCAATRMQLGMDHTKNGSGEEPKAGIPPELRLTGEMLISLAETSLRQFNIIDDTSLDSMLASFFLFACYGNLNNTRHAWFYLNQSISLAHERERRRRVFWLLFVTERTFALQHRRSVMLRSSVTKPQVIDSDCPVVMNDFINHIRLFELLPWSLYEWQAGSDNHQLDDLGLVHTINSKLCSIQADQSVIESQRFDTLITQQWLRVSMWRLAFGKKPSSAYQSGLLLPPGLPTDVGKIIMSALSSVDPRSKDCHGIGMEQKLFDVGISLADSALLPSWSCSSFEMGPRDLLYPVIEALSTARGCQSHLLSALLKYSEDVLRLTDPAAHVNLRLDIPQDAEDPSQETVVEPISAQGLLDLSTLGPSPSWEDMAVLGEQIDPNIGISLR